MLASKQETSSHNRIIKQLSMLHICLSKYEVSSFSLYEEIATMYAVCFILVLLVYVGFVLPADKTEVVFMFSLQQHGLYHIWLPR